MTIEEQIADLKNIIKLLNKNQQILMDQYQELLVRVAKLEKEKNERPT